MLSHENINVTVTSPKTLVLLLESPESDVIETSCKALIQQLENENSLIFLMNLEVVPKLIKILKHPDHEVRDIALRCLHLIAAKASKSLHLKDADILPAFVSLLQTSDPLLIENTLLYLKQYTDEIEDRIELLDTGALAACMQLVEFGCSRNATLLILDIATVVCEDSKDLPFEITETLPVVIPLINSKDSDVQLRSLKMLSALAQMDDSIKLLLHDCGILGELYKTFLVEKKEISAQALRVLSTLSSVDEINRDMSKRDDWVNTLLRCCQYEENDIQSRALQALSYCLLNNKARDALSSSEAAMQQIIAFINSSSYLVSKNAIMCLHNFSLNEAYVEKIVKNKGVFFLASLFSTERESEILGIAGQTLSYCLQSKEALLQLEEIDGFIAAVMRVLESSPPLVQRNICSLLASLASDKQRAEEIIALGGIGLLFQLTERNVQGYFNSAVDAAEKILNFHLPAKYWLRRHLTVENIIEDGFYDIARGDPLDIRVVRQFPSLQELINLPVRPDREVIVVDSRVDSKLAEYIEKAQDDTFGLPMDDQVDILASFVCELMGGVISSQSLSDDVFRDEIEQVKETVESSVIPIGSVTDGYFYHRALLFKTLADRCGIPCSLYKGEQGRAWNGVVLTLEDNFEEGYLVDLMHEPGRLMLLNSLEARLYQRLY